MGIWYVNITKRSYWTLKSRSSDSCYFVKGLKKKKKILPHKSLLYLCTSFSTPQQRSPNRPLRYHSLFRHFSNYQDFLILLVVISTRL